MANSNRTVWSFANRKWSCIDYKGANTREDADNAKNQLQAQYPSARVLIRSYRFGSRKNPSRGYIVRAYEVPSRKSTGSAA